MNEDEVVLYLDTETFSERPLAGVNSVGTYAYAEAAEVLVLAWALDGPWGEGDIVVEDLTDDDGVGNRPGSADYFAALRDCDRIVIHNSGFDRTISLYSDQIGDLPLEKIEDTMIRAMEHGLPGGLDKLSAIFKLGDDAKHDGGKDLIRLFCKNQPKNQKIRRHTKHTKPDEWERFLSYAGGDIRSMRALRAKLPWWNYPGKPSGNRPATEMQLFQLDRRINDRGFKVDLELATSALAMIDRVKDQHDEYFDETTFGDVQSAGQRDKLLKHLLEFYGVALPDMQKGTIERRLNDPDLPDIVKELLATRLDAAMASTSKYKALLRAVSADGRLKGTLQFCGAIRTGRWAGRLFQPQNLIRPNGSEAEMVDEWIDDIKAGIGEMVLPNPSRAAAVVLRGAIVAEEGHTLLAADLSNIEGRGLAWLAGEQWKLDAFREYDEGTGHDLYILGAARILRKSPDDVTPDERQTLGKVPELACGYQGAAGAFSTMAQLYGLDLPPARVDEIVQGWREANPAIKSFWYACESAAIKATLNPGQTFTAGKLAFHRVGEWLLMQLPSGRKLVYTQPAMIPHPMFDNAQSLSYLGVNTYTRKWERIPTYGGKLAENATQALARDVLGEAMLRIDDAGFPIILTVHDEIICEVPEDRGFTSDRLCALLAAEPDWSDGNFPLAASGFEAKRYRKD